ncbi:uncharacterized protein GIQ15_01792 [Arthroderma uncinatum]|uniref:uncharacterized protein n=1 Tax=Arthroderma uncinatum TaxID=74035 RepID=UPI00144A6682|nr:uncharacterized protein GIQ15_01792 [Arthroderma uncinatum]KAF3492275.1 hypothetical protein GIQ15_01792 [Arthroderma uncinatum]
MNDLPKKCTPEEVISAVEAYRKFAAEHARESLELLIRKGEEQELGPGWEGEDEAKITAARLSSCEQYLHAEDGLPGFNSPRELLSRYEEVVDRYALDGVVRWHRKGARRNASMSTEEYMKILDQAIRDSISIPTSIPFEASIPEEYKTLMQHVDSLHGVGLPIQRRPPPFWVGYIEGEDTIKSRVLAKERINGLQSAWLHGYEIATGWEAGKTDDGYIFVVLCQSEEMGKPWHWRYARVEWSTPDGEVWDDIPSFLEYHAQRLPSNAKDPFIPLDDEP